MQDLETTTSDPRGTSGRDQYMLFSFVKLQRARSGVSDRSLRVCSNKTKRTNTRDLAETRVTQGRGQRITGLEDQLETSREVEYES